MKINQTTMQEYFEEFDVLRNKFLYSIPKETVVDSKIWDGLIRNFYSQGREYWDMNQAVETFRTMDKVYHYGDDRNAENCNTLEQVIEKFLRQYVNIEGMEELFQSSYFYFEWMMHLEYQERQHDYSYYRDHYMHQIRNLYEMFVLLEKDEIWRLCMDIYKSKSNKVADDIRNSVQEQQNQISQRVTFLRDVEKNFPEWNLEECCYHYIIFATAIVSSLVHDIGYPIVYMKRNMDRIHGFLPISHIFMDMKNSMPDIKRLLSNSLLFATVEGDEIQRRLEKNDHGAYSAIILLYQYYDNGRIFSLDPVKRMVVELSALVIYNHTLKYAFQDQKKFDRYQNVFVDNPISYLFRLCDDLQEWERVYFLICDKSAFFICDTCMTPMIRHKNKTHISGGREDQKFFSYSCVCGKTGWNSLWFPYRRMINVAPFTDLVISDTEKEREEKPEKWTFELKCDKKALLQLAHYNDTFAIQRLRGIRELRAMVREQGKLPDMCLKAFVSNNPVAIKAKILEEFINDYINDNPLSSTYFSGYHLSYNYIEKKFSIDLIKGLEGLKNYLKLIKEAEQIYQKLDGLILKFTAKNKKMHALMEDSVEFYLFLIILSREACKRALGFPKNDREAYEKELSIYCDVLARSAVDAWDIRDNTIIALIADYFALVHSDFFYEQSLYERDPCFYQLTYPLRQDICDIVKSHMDDKDYLDICKSGNRKGKFGENKFDFYSDYFLYFLMDVCLEKEGHE